MTDAFRREEPENSPPETQDEIRARERRQHVHWMRGVMRQKPTDAARRAFLDKVHSVASAYGITFEELMNDR